MRHFSNLQALRGVAALLVIGIHAMSLPDRMGAPYLVIPLWSVGPAGVDLFFVISGFIITSVAIHAAKGAGTNAGIAREFAIKRLVRIYPLFWIALFVFWLAFPTINIMAGQSFTMAPMWQMVLLVTQSNYLVQAAWSLGFEVYFYLVMTVILLFWPKRIYASLVIWALASALLVTASAVFDPLLKYEPVTSPLLIEFMFGVLVAHLIQKGESRFAWSALAFGIVLFVIGGELNRNYFNWNPVYRWLCFGPASALIVYGALALEMRDGIVSPRPFQRLGDASYSIYIWHQPMFFAIGAGFTVLGLRPILPTWTLFPISIALVIVWGLISYHWIERPMQAFLLKRLLNDGARYKRHLVLVPTILIAACLIASVPATRVSERLFPPTLPADFDVALRGAPEIKESTAINIQEFDRPLKLIVNLHSEGAGAMYFGYHSSGLLVEQWRDFKPGDNRLEIVVPVVLDGRDIWIAREKPYTDMVITSLKVEVY